MVLQSETLIIHSNIQRKGDTRLPRRNPICLTVSELCHSFEFHCFLPGFVVERDTVTLRGATIRLCYIYNSKRGVCKLYCDFKFCRFFHIKVKPGAACRGLWLGHTQLFAPHW
jgi:hypothetical protein